MRVDDADLLDEFLEEQTVYSADFQALILQMVSFQSGNVQQVSNQTGVAVSTIYGWLSDWNKTQRLEKKKRYLAFKAKKVACQLNRLKNNGIIGVFL
jgi:transposase-like protein